MLNKLLFGNSKHRHKKHLTRAKLQRQWLLIEKANKQHLADFAMYLDQKPRSHNVPRYLNQLNEKAISFHNAFSAPRFLLFLEVHRGRQFCIRTHTSKYPSAIPDRCCMAL